MMINMIPVLIVILCCGIFIDGNTIAEGIYHHQDGSLETQLLHNQTNFNKVARNTLHFDQRVGRRRLRRRKDFSLESITIDSIEIKLDWEDFLKGKRIGSALTLKKNRRFIENALLYYPKDGVFTVRGLLDATSYLGQVKIIKDNKGKSYNSSQDSIQFKINTPRIVSESETKDILRVLSKLPRYAIKLETVSVGLKLPEIQSGNLFLEVSRISGNLTVPRALVRVVSSSSVTIVNDLPAQSVVKISLKTLNISRSATEHTSILLFTGSIVFLQNNTLPRTSSKLSIQKATGLEKKKEIVTCHIKNKETFQGFPCKGSQVCIPLPWVCDGENDCKDGYDEEECDSGGQSSQSAGTIYQSLKKCNSNEFQCLSEKGVVCLPLSALCDGQVNCANGWDEHEKNCKSQTLNPEYETETHDYGDYSSRCKRNFFRCRRGGCIPIRYVCDGYKDCRDGSDEINCSDDEDYEYPCDPNHEFICYKSSGSKCIPKAWVCDDQEDCAAGEDEDENCYYY